MRILLTLLAAGSLLLSAALPAAGAEPVSRVIDKIQKQYDQTRSFRARFVQKSLLKVMGQTLEARGTVVIKKPGKMKWDYTAPDPQLLISNEKSLWLYLPEERQVNRMEVESVYSSNTPALFLAGHGKLTESFQVAKLENAAKFLEVTLVPKERDHNVKILVLIVDSKSYQILGSRVYDKLGNQTEILFSGIEINPEVSDRTFEFKVPPGVEVIDFSGATPKP